MLPLFGAVPGGPEMLIILLIMILMFFGPVLVLVLLGVGYLGTDDRTEQLERRIEDLEAKVGDDGRAGTDARPSGDRRSESDADTDRR